ncbi:hypothetical protein [Cryobacterium sp. TMS1-20-1]|nr:hypothetical protein [Cryobacterium sp. TMS1-20-1]
MAGPAGWTAAITFHVCTAGASVDGVLTAIGNTRTRPWAAPGRQGIPG